MKKATSLFFIAILLIVSYGCEDNSKDSKMVYGPESISASDGIYNDRIVIKWEREADAIKYKIYRAVEEKVLPELISDISTNVYVDKTIEINKKYFYYVTSLNSSGQESKLKKYDGGFSSSKAFDVPEKIEASKGTYKNRIGVGWTMVKTASSYKVYRATSPNNEPGNIGTTMGATSTAYIDNTALSGVTYYYYVSAVSQSGIESAKTDYSVGYW